MILKTTNVTESSLQSEIDGVKYSTVQQNWTREPPPPLWSHVVVRFTHFAWILLAVQETDEQRLPGITRVVSGEIRFHFRNFPEPISSVGLNPVA